MIEITQRQKLILDKIVREYIQKAMPVSSQALESKYQIGLKPASIRLELHKLTELGYLEQPHTSSGRVPTDKGYRFFVDEFFEQKKFVFYEKKILEEISHLEKEVADSLRFFSELTKLLAGFSSNLAFTYVADEMVCFKEGWEKVLKEPEFQNLDYTREFTTMLHKLEESIEFLLKNNEGNEEINVFIGKESKIPCAANFSLILGSAKFPKRKRGALAILGPKRMSYPRNIRLMNSFLTFLEKC